MAVFNFAAILIQKHVRGLLIRRRTWGYQVKQSKKIAQLKKRIHGRQLERYMKYLDRIKDCSLKPLWLAGGFSAWCAVRIQAVFRMSCARKRFLQQKRLVNQVACIIIQTFWRNVLVRSRNRVVFKQPIKLSHNNAAKRIQFLWRSFCNRRIFGYFRDLVLYKLKGAPVELLRAIIPNEAGLLDRAAGIHVKFRLGGWIFPPKVYFKIFTHRPLCDVNAFAPRDYTKEYKLDPIAINNKKRVVKSQGIKVGVRYFETIVPSTNKEGTKNWYRREDNNDWRPISSHKFEAISTPPWFQESNHVENPKPFHHSRLFRQQDILAMRKKKKRDWMLKLYKLSQRDSDLQHEVKSEEKRPSSPQNDYKQDDSAFKGNFRNNEHKSEAKDYDLVKWRYALFTKNLYLPCFMICH
jgi:hypothetical protein